MKIEVMGLGEECLVGCVVFFVLSVVFVFMYVKGWIDFDDEIIKVNKKLDKVCIVVQKQRKFVLDLMYRDKVVVVMQEVDWK